MADVEDSGKPRRIQLSRKKGWRMPPNTVSVARPGRWGNPFAIGRYAKLGDPDGYRGPFRMAYSLSCIGAQPGYTLIETNEQAVDFYRRYAEAWSPEYLARVQRELGGKNLACWCKPGARCHADVLLELANQPPTTMGGESHG